MTGRQIDGSCATLGEVLRAAADAFGDSEAFVEPAPATVPGLGARGTDGRSRLTFGAWDAAADAVGALFSQMGVRRGDVVCLLLPSSIDYAVCYLAAARLGAVTSGVNLRLGPGEQASIMARLQPTVTVFDPAAASHVAAGAGQLVARGDLAGVHGTPAAATCRADDPVAVVWTSGSTGRPKGAVFDHRRLQAVAAGTDVLSQPGDRRLSPLPFAHVGYMTRAWDEIAHRVATVVAPQPWSAAAALDLLGTEAVTVGQGVPTQWALMLEHPAFAATDTSSLRIAATGAARVPAELVGQMRARLGCPVVVRYTSTETALGTGTVPGDPDDVVATTVGRPVPGVEVVVADASGAEVAPGEVGTVRIRSAATMCGYLGDRSAGVFYDDEATAAVKDADGFVTTGDLGVVGADGNLRLVGRAAEMYIRGGYNVYPAEVEAVIGAFPGVRQVAVVGAADRVLGEVGVAFVCASGPVDHGELVGWCRSRLADYKAPDVVVEVPELPLTAMAKIDKLALAGPAAQAAAGRDPKRKVG